MGAIKVMFIHPSITSVHLSVHHDDVIKWNFGVTGPLCGEFTGHRWILHTNNGALMFSLICAWINAWENNCEAGDLRCHHAHYDVIAMINHVHPSVCLSVYISWMLKYGWCCKGTILWLFIPWTNEIDYDLFRQSHVHFTITYFPKRSWYTDP